MRNKTTSQRYEIEGRLAAFFDDPENLDHLRFDDTGHLRDIGRQADEGGMAVFGFGVRTKKGKGAAERFKCNPAELALLLTAESLSASVFVDHANGKPYLKVCGLMPASAGITAARIFAGHEAGEDTLHLSGDTRDLTHQNLGERYNPRTERGRTEVYGEILSHSTSNGHTFERRKRLLDRALDCLDAERDIALGKNQGS